MWLSGEEPSLEDWDTESQGIWTRWADPVPLKSQSRSFAGSAAERSVPAQLARPNHGHVFPADCAHVAWLSTELWKPPQKWHSSFLAIDFSISVKLNFSFLGLFMYWGLECLIQFLDWHTYCHSTRARGESGASGPPCVPQVNFKNAAYGPLIYKWTCGVLSAAELAKWQYLVLPPCCKEMTRTFGVLRATERLVHVCDMMCVCVYTSMHMCECARVWVCVHGGWTIRIIQGSHQPSSKKKELSGQVKCLPGQHRTWVQIPNSHVKARHHVVRICNPSSGKAGTGRWQGLPGQWVSLQAQFWERCHL